MNKSNDLVLERTLNAPRDLVWKAWTDPKLLKQWFAPKPYEISEVEMDLSPGGVFRIRMVGPDGLDTGHGNPGCVLEVVDREKLVWTSALGPQYRPAEAGEGCESFPMTAVVIFADAGNGTTFYRAVALHRNSADRDMHEKWASTKAGANAPSSSRRWPRSLPARTRDKENAREPSDSRASSVTSVRA